MSKSRNIALNKSISDKYLIYKCSTNWQLIWHCTLIPLHALFDMTQFTICNQFLLFITQVSSEQYNEAVKIMDQYTLLPAKRLVHLVKKYTHHAHMKAIEGQLCLQELQYGRNLGKKVLCGGNTHIGSYTQVFREGVEGVIQPIIIILPKRLVHLVKKYTHHGHMKAIEGQLFLQELQYGRNLRKKSTLWE